MKTRFSKIMSSIFAGILTASSLMCDAGSVLSNPVCAAEDIRCITDIGSNINRHDYCTNPNYADPILSNLVPLSDGSWMRVQGGIRPLGNNILVENYDAKFNLTERKLIEMQLPMYGTFYAASDGNYYVITGNADTANTQNLQMFDFAKYSPDWKLIAHVQTKGTDVQHAFRAGCVRCAENGRYLLVHTARLNYNRHQTNYTLALDMQEMKITDQTAEQYTGKGFVSHSLNQFVLLDGNNPVTLDQGDGWPRSVYLQKYPSDFSNGSFTVTNGTCIGVDMVVYYPADNLADVDNDVLNFTGVSVGGFEQSSTHYLVAYNTIDQNLWPELAEGRAFRDRKTTRNVMIAAVPKDDLRHASVKRNAVTDYAEGNGSGSNPYLIPVGADRFLLMWANGSKVYWVFLDGTGTVSGQQYSMEASLSDCEPVITGDKVYWYTWNQSDIRFYSIDLKHPDQTSAVKRVAGHEYQRTETPDEAGYVYDICTKCGDQKSYIYPQDFSVSILKRIPSEDMEMHSYFYPDRHIMDQNDEFTFDFDGVVPSSFRVSRDSYVLEITEGAEYIEELETDRTSPYYQKFRVREFSKDSVSIVMRFYLKMNPSLVKEVHIKAAHSYEVTGVDEDAAIIKLRCKVCGRTKLYNMNTLRSSDDEAVTVSLEQDTFEYDHETHSPAVSVTLKDPETGNAKTFEQGKDYNVIYIDNLNAGTAYALCTPAEGSILKGSSVIAFEIMPQPLSGCSPLFQKSRLDPDDPEVDIAQAIQPRITILDKQRKILSEDIYHTKASYHFTDDETHLYSIDYIFQAHDRNYANTLTASYRIHPISIQNYAVEFADPDSASCLYNGNSQEPEVTVKSPKGRILEKDKDFVVTYQNNVECGTATATVQGLMCYNGTVKLKFEILDEIHAMPPRAPSGDADGDGEMTKKDIECFGCWLSGNPEATLDDWAAVDMNQDRKLNATDLTLLKQTLFLMNGKI